MAASSGLYCSPGHPPLGDVLGIALVDCQVSKGPAKEVHLFAIIDLLLCITLAKQPCYGQLKIGKIGKIPEH